MSVEVTMSVSEQLQVLADHPRTMPHTSHHPYQSICACTDFGELASILRTVGIEPTDVAAFEALNGLWFPEPAEPQGRRLDLSAEVYQQWMYDLGVSSLVGAQNTASLARLGREQQRLRHELKVSMQAEVDEYVGLLQPAFEEALATYTPALEAGLTYASTPETVLELGEDTIQTYLAVRRNRSALALDAIVGIRARISTALGVAPHFWVEGPPNEFGTRQGQVVSYGAGVDAGPAFEQHQGWRRWLEIARVGTARPLLVTDIRS